MNIVQAHTIYFLGIGGIGMSALARLFLKMGKAIHGYDLTPTPLTRQLEEEGMHIHYNENIQLIPEETDLVIYTPAVPKENKELIYIRESGLPILKRAEVIGLLTKENTTVAVAGTHGKTSICAITAHLLKNANLNLTAFVGGIMKNYGSNLIASTPTNVLLVEADEFDRSFLQIEPDIAVVSSMDADHLDIYGDHTEMQNNFYQFVGKLKHDGLLVYNEKLEELSSSPARKISYGFERSSAIYAEYVRVVSGRFQFDLVADAVRLKNITMVIPGRHYIENALASIAIAIELGISKDKIREGLESFQGVERRFDLRLQKEDLIFIDDYAHHPAEIEATIAAVKELHPDKKITGVFQPHLFSRTRDHVEGFARTLDTLDEIILLSIYPAREKPIDGVNSQLILDKMENTHKLLLSKQELLTYLQEQETEVLLTLGAGDIGLMVDEIESILLDK